MNNLVELLKYGQSYWLDNLTRKMVKDGSLKEMVEKQGLRGQTSNPAIFHNAITKSNDYDGQIAELAKAGKSTREIYEELVIQDVRDACDIFKPVYEESNGVDGYVSLEVSPLLARHGVETLYEARDLFARVDRPNLMIKIPGTREGLYAIEEALYEGININVTLLFSVESYEAVARTYIKALQRRKAEGLPVNNIASVASFFISRIDTLVDQLLGHRILEGSDNEYSRKAQSLLGEAALASGKLAYQSFKKIFSGPEWEELAALGARVQRPLWASTSTKNPQYSDVLYVEPLIGPDTVNTMPDNTIAAFADHGNLAENTIEQDVDAARATFAALKELGIDMAYVAQRLEDEGIQKFIDPFGKLLNSIEEKAQQYK